MQHMPVGSEEPKNEIPATGGPSRLFIFPPVAA